MYQFNQQHRQNKQSDQTDCLGPDNLQGRACSDRFPKASRVLLGMDFSLILGREACLVERLLILANLKKRHDVEYLQAEVLVQVLVLEVVGVYLEIPVTKTPPERELFKDRFQIEWPSEEKLQLPCHYSTEMVHKHQLNQHHQILLSSHFLLSQLYHLARFRLLNQPMDLHSVVQSVVTTTPLQTKKRTSALTITSVDTQCACHVSKSSKIKNAHTAAKLVLSSPQTMVSSMLSIG